MQAIYNTTIQAGGLSITNSVTRTSDTSNPLEVSVEAGKSGTLTTRTDANTGVVTVASGHGITTSNLVDIYDSAGLLIRKGMTVTATASTTIDVDGGAGSDLPTVSSSVVICKQTPIEFWMKEDGIQIWGVQFEVAGATTQARILFEDAAGDDVYDATLTANSAIVEDVAGGATNSLDNSGDPITTVTISNGNATLSGTLKIISLEDRTA